MLMGIAWAFQARLSNAAVKDPAELESNTLPKRPWQASTARTRRATCHSAFGCCSQCVFSETNRVQVCLFKMVRQGELPAAGQQQPCRSDGAALSARSLGQSTAEPSTCYTDSQEPTPPLSLLSWDSLMGGKETEVAQSCLTLGDPIDCSPPGFSVHGVFQARILEWVAISLSRGSSRPRD